MVSKSASSCWMRWTSRVSIASHRLRSAATMPSSSVIRVLSGAVNVVRRNAHVAAHPAANAIARRPPSTPRKSISIATPLLIYSVPGLAPVHPGRVYIVDDAVDGCASGHAHERACWWHRSDEKTSELQSLMRISYAVFCLNKKKLEQR